MRTWNTELITILLMCTLVTGCGLYAIQKGQQALPDHNQGMEYLKQGHYDNAIAAFNRALSIYSKFGASLGGRGAAYEAKGLYDEALSDYSKLIEIAPENPWAYMDRAKVYYLKQHYDEAWNDVRKARSLGLNIERNAEYSSFIDRLKAASGQKQ